MEQKNNAGALFKNEKRENENHPHYKGSAVIDGTEMYVSAWVKDSKTGAKYMSLSFSPKQVAPAATTKPVSANLNPDDDGMPF